MTFDELKFKAEEFEVKNTISSVTYEACKKYPIIAAALGALLYHLVSGRL